MRKQEPALIRFPIGKIEELKKEAAKIGCSFNSYILLLIDSGKNHLNNYKKE